MNPTPSNNDPPDGLHFFTHSFVRFTLLWVWFQSLPTEHARQVFASRDKTQAGTIPAVEFVSLMEEIRGFRMSSYVREHLLSVS